MDILLLSAYEAQSHHQWRLGMLEQLKHHNWNCLTLPPRYFSWRIRGNSLYWSQSHKLNKDYDLLMATSMVDLATLRGLVPMLSRIPNLLYFHENQLAYPVSEKQHASVEPQMVTFYAALSADQLLFNTQYNLNTLHDFQGLSVLEAMASGCQALVPDRLAYPEFVPPSCRYKSDLDNEQKEAQAAATLLQQRLVNENNISQDNGVSVQHYSR